MMNTAYRFWSYICAFLAAFAVLSCEKNTGIEDGFDEGIILTLQTSELAGMQVKGTPTEGDDDYNENLLNSVYYFFYPKGTTTTAPIVSGFKTGLSSTDTYTIKIPVSANTVVNDLFASSNECRLFAVANPPSSLVSKLEGKPSLDSLRAMTVLSSLENVPLDNFVMVYDSTLTASSLSGKIAINQTVQMEHLAVKFTLGALVIPSITEGTATYTPDVVSVYFCNGLNRTTLHGWKKGVAESDDYFTTEFAEMSVATPSTVTLNEGTADEETLNKYELETPIYSYPMEWQFNSETEPYLMYDVRWKISDGGNTSYKDLYYKLTLGRKAIKKNEWYDISAKLTVLGSLYPEEPTEIYYYMDYLVKDWKGALSDDGINTPAQIKDTRYLAVQQTDWTLNNKEEVTIPFSSSHECEVVNAKIITVSYETGIENKTTTNLNPVNTTPVKFDLSVQNEITVTHKLNNTLGSSTDVTPITIEFDLRHKDNTSFTEHITIVQNPAIFLATYANSGGRSSTYDYGYTYVNNAQTGNWQIVLGANSSGNNSSIYLTVITVSQFDPSTGFIVGDPRDPNYDNLDINSGTAGVQWNAVNPVSAPAKYKGDGQTANRTIKYYHPTIDDGSMDNVVAPSIRVNSANCRSGQNETYQNAKQRCAAYQEDGYPAGRWRLPTLAECKLIQTMSSNGFVPTIFIQNNTSYYCYAGGWFTGSASQDSDYHPYNGTPSYSKTTSTGGSGGGAARCVYDEWYWSQVDAAMGWNNSTKSFTWGDVPDDFVIPTT